MVFMIFMILFIVAVVGIAGFEIFKAIKLIKNLAPKSINYPLEIRKFFFSLIAEAVAMTMLFMFLSLYMHYKMDAFEWVQLILGSAIFGFTN